MTKTVGQLLAYTESVSWEMCILRWMCGKSRRDKIENERISEYLETTHIEDKIKEEWLTWYAHVMVQLPVTPIRSVYICILDGAWTSENLD